MTKAEHARALWARGCRDIKAIAEEVGSSYSAVWHAVRVVSRVPSGPPVPTADEVSLARELCTKRHVHIDAMVDEVAMALAKARAAK